MELIEIRVISYGLEWDSKPSADREFVRHLTKYKCESECADRVGE